MNNTLIKTLKKPKTIIAVLILLLIGICTVQVFMYRTDVTTEETAALETMLNNYEYQDDIHKDFTDMKIDRDYSEISIEHLEILGEKKLEDNRKCYYAIKSHGTLTVKKGDLITEKYKKVKPDRYNCVTVFVEEKDGKEVMTGEIGAYDSVTGERQKEAGFPRLYMLYTELIHPKTDLNKYYEQDKASVMKML